MTGPVSAAMTLADYAVECGCCREALAVPLGHKGLYNFACMGCVGRDIAIDPRIDSQRAKARHLKDTLMAKDFDAAMKAREQWIEHDFWVSALNPQYQEDRHAAT